MAAALGLDCYLGDVNSEEDVPSETWDDDCMGATDEECVTSCEGLNPTCFVAKFGEERFFFFCGTSPS